jgi:hypothetical protein
LETRSLDHQLHTQKNHSGIVVRGLALCGHRATCRRPPCFRTVSAFQKEARRLSKRVFVHCRRNSTLPKRPWVKWALVCSLRINAGIGRTQSSMSISTGNGRKKETGRTQASMSISTGSGRKKGNHRFSNSSFRISSTNSLPSMSSRVVSRPSETVVDRTGIPSSSASCI